MRQTPACGNEQKKSVFDRLGRQLEPSGGHQRQMKRRPSPGQYGGDFMGPPQPHSMMDMNSYHNRYGREPLPPGQSPDWRYQNAMNDRRHMPPFSRERHPSGPPPPPPPPHMQSMPLQPHPYDIDPRQAPYYPHHGYPGAPPAPSPGAPMMPNEMGMRRSSPKYDRHGNMIVGFKDRGGPHMRLGPMDHHPSMSPSRSFMPSPGGPPMMHPGPHEMNPNMRHGGYPPPGHLHPRLHDNMEPDFPPLHDGRIMQDSPRFSPVASLRFQPMLMKQQQQPPQAHMMNQSGPPHMNPTQHPNFGGDNPRYAKWRERREAITSLDRETAQSSSKTDSLKSTLQQPDNRINIKNENPSKKPKLTQSGQNEAKNKGIASDDKDSTEKTTLKEAKQMSRGNSNKTDPQDISDGEIIDDEDSSDDSDSAAMGPGSSTNKLLTQPYGTARDSNKYFDPKPKNAQNTGSGTKRKLMHDRDEYETLDYETISDDDLDDIMGNKKNSENVDKSTKSLSEVELLNALGLDWAHLVELSKKSKSQSLTQGSALARFSTANYLPTLGITKDLAGPDIFELVAKVCRL